MFLTFAVVNGIVTAAAVIAHAVVLGNLLSEIFAGSKSSAGITRVLGLLLSIYTIRALTSWIGEWAAHKTSATAKRELRSSLARKIFNLGPMWVGQHRSSELVTTAMRGLDALDVYFSKYLPQLVLAAIIPLAVGVTILTNDLLSAVIVALTVPLIPFFMALVGWFTQAQVDKQWQSLQRLAGHFLDLITGLPTLKAFNRSQSQEKGLQKIGEDYRTNTMSVLKISFLSSFVLELISTISVALVAVSIGLRLVNGNINLREGLIILILVPEAYLPLRALGTQFHAMTEGLEASDRVFTILETVSVENKGHYELTNVGDITFTNVSVTYPDSYQPALSNFNASFHKGELSVITGFSGSGKTTAIATLLKFVTEYEGEITVDGISLRDISTQSLRQHISYLPQQPWLPHGTLRQSLSLTGLRLDDDLISACMRVGLDIHDATQFPNGLDTVLSSQGGMSSGQRRRVALARVLLQNRPVLILDEPTAAVDAQTEELITTIIQELVAAGSTVIAVAHRPSLIVLADSVTNIRQLEVTS